MKHTGLSGSEVRDYSCTVCLPDPARAAPLRLAAGHGTVPCAGGGVGGGRGAFTFFFLEVAAVVCATGGTSIGTVCTSAEAPLLVAFCVAVFFFFFLCLFFPDSTAVTAPDTFFIVGGAAGPPPLAVESRRAVESDNCFPSGATTAAAVGVEFANLG